MTWRPPSDRETRFIGFLIQDPMVAAGHPLTCNGGNPDVATHHDHEVLMQIRANQVQADPLRIRVLLRCPECGRLQPVSVGMP